MCGFFRIFGYDWSNLFCFFLWNFSFIFFFIQMRRKKYGGKLHVQYPIQRSSSTIQTLISKLDMPFEQYISSWNLKLEVKAPSYFLISLPWKNLKFVVKFDLNFQWLERFFFRFLPNLWFSCGFLTAFRSILIFFLFLRLSKDRGITNSFQKFGAISENVNGNSRDG